MTSTHALTPSSHHSCNTQSVLSFCLQISRNIKQLKQTHARVLRTGTVNHHLLLQLTSKILRLPTANLRYARHVFSQIPRCQNEFIWTSLIRSHSLHSRFIECISLYVKMHCGDVRPSAFTFSSVLSACARLPAIQEGRQTHDLVIKSGFFSNKVVQTALLDMYAKCGVVDDARLVFDGMCERDVVSWTAMVAGFAKAGWIKDARRLFDEMPERNVVSWTAMVAGYANSGDVTAARELFDEMPERNAVSWTAMIAGYGKCGDVDSARRIFDEIPVRDPTTWAVMIACYAQNGFSNEAIEMFWEMKNTNLTASEVAMVAAMSACTQVGDAAMANSIAKHLEESSSSLTLIAANALIDMHAKCGDIDSACQVFNKMKERDVISYTALITGLANHGRAQDALKFFRKMQEEGIPPNGITFVGVLTACSHAGMVDAGCAYFKLMTQTYRIVPLTAHYSCMVDLLGRAGRLEEAYGLIESISGASDVEVWGALLGACRVHCNAELGEIAAKRLFKIEPENTGNYVLLSNIYASLNRWDEAERVRRLMREKGVSKSPGFSWISNGA